MTVCAMGSERIHYAHHFPAAAHDDLCIDAGFCVSGASPRFGSLWPSIPNHWPRQRRGPVLCEGATGNAGQSKYIPCWPRVPVASAIHVHHRPALSDR